MKTTHLLIPLAILALLFAINPKGTLKTMEHAATWLATKTLYKAAVHER